MRRKPSHMPTGRLQSLRLFSTLLAITLIMPCAGHLSVMAVFDTCHPSPACPRSYVEVAGNGAQANKRAAQCERPPSFQQAHDP
jgi:hypothetical protein